MSILKLKKSMLWGILFFALPGIISCDDSPDGEPEPETESAEYGIWVDIETDQTYSYLLLVPDLMKDTVISPLNSGIDAEGNIDGTYGTVKDGYYYTPSSNKLSKLQVQNGTFA